MKRFSTLTTVLVLMLILSACGGRAPEPDATPTPVDLQGTMAAAAFTLIAETQAAIPTATPLPPTATATNTAAPTNTFLPVPVTEAAGTSAPDSSSGGQDPCVNQPMPAPLKGQPVQIRVNNSTKADLAFSVYLNSSESQSQCGYRTYTITPEQPLVINDLVEGCYTLWAWNPIPEDYFIVTNGTTCVNTSRDWRFDISTSSITLR